MIKLIAAQGKSAGFPCKEAFYIYILGSAGQVSTRGKTPKADAGKWM
jgi:hypothetical protein